MPSVTILPIEAKDDCEVGFGTTANSGSAGVCSSKTILSSTIGSSIGVAGATVGVVGVFGVTGIVGFTGVTGTGAVIATTVTPWVPEMVFTLCES